MLPIVALIVVKFAIAVLVVVAIAQLAAYYHRFTFFHQYVFFCRFPLFFGLLVVCLPLLMIGPARSLLGNLAELSVVGVGIAAFAGIFTCWIILFVLTRTLEIAPYKTKLPYMRRGYSCAGASGTIALRDQSRRLRLLCTLGKGILDETGHSFRRLAYAALLGVPLCVVVVYKSSLVDGDVRGALLALNSLSASVGVAFAALLRWQFTRLHRKKDWYTSAASAPVLRASDFILTRLFRLDPQALPLDIRIRQAQAVFFAASVFLLYVVAGLLTLPNWPDRAYGLIPAFVLILMLLWVYAFVYSLLAVALDSYRVPVLTVVFVGMGLLYFVLETDYTYELRPIGNGPASSLQTASAEIDLTPAEALSAWRRGRGADARTAVVVAASGGGITAAQWTAEVLTRLHEGLGPAFGASLLMLSTTSGGSTGGMYYTDRFPDLASPTDRPAILDSIRTAAAMSSLNAAVHGLVFGDVWRFIPGANLVLSDRGNALEDVWQRRLAHPEASILGWGRDARAGVRPVHLFNTTMAEAGGLLMISPLRHDGRAYYDSFRRLYHDHDLGVATAARLSATFPFVTPQARPIRAAVDDTAAYHLADGGYFDNQGLLGALTFVDEAYRGRESTDTTVAWPDRVLLIKIVAFETAQQKAEPGAGWKFTFFGPVVTVMNMRSAAQQSRGAMEEALFERLLEANEGVTVDAVTFSLGRDNAPLSWHLTDANRLDIRCAWNDREDQFQQVQHALGIAVAAFDTTRVADCPVKVGLEET